MLPALAATRHSVGRVAEAHEADVGVLVGQGAPAVQARHDPGATVLLGGIGQRHPAGQVLLGSTKAYPLS